MDIENAHEPSAVDDQVDHAETEFQLYSPWKFLS